ncbi:MAG TPA: polyphenol oxidase family protein [Solirubrobacteraceae bacterium]|nr:polyphenol oxidase family protein [Solirubrobacteraceae bacterium]
MAPPPTDPLRFDLTAGGQALFTSRAHGNLSTVRAQTRAQGMGARERLRRQLELRRLCAGPQVHGTDIQRLRARDGVGAEPLTAAADGRATALAGVGVMVLTADCLPVLLGSDRAVAAVHAGWRGLAAGVLEEGVRALRELTETSREPNETSREPSRTPGAQGHARAEPEHRDGEIVAIIGPGAGPCCYEVGPEVHDAFDGAHRVGSNVDLPAIARERLLRAGVDRVEHVRLCTICDARFFSHRREGQAAGRQAGVAWLS